VILALAYKEYCSFRLLSSDLDEKHLEQLARLAHRPAPGAQGQLPAVGAELPSGGERGPAQRDREEQADPAPLEQQPSGRAGSKRLHESSQLISRADQGKRRGGG